MPRYSRRSQQLLGQRRMRQAERKGSLPTTLEFTKYGHTTGQNNPWHKLQAPEYPVRDVAIAKKLIEIYYFQDEVNGAIGLLARDAFSTPSGGTGGPLCADGWGKKDKEGKWDHPIHPETQEIVERTLRQKHDGELIIGGSTTMLDVMHALAYGNGYRHIVIVQENGRYKLQATQKMKTWSTIAIPDEYGYVQHYEYYPDPYAITHRLDVPKGFVIDFCWNRQGLYGLPLTFRSTDDWETLKKSNYDCQIASSEAAINPLVHKFAKDATYYDTNNNRINNPAARYEQDLREKRARGLLSDVVLYPGMDLSRPGNAPNPTPVTDRNRYLRTKFIPAGMPTYYFPFLAGDKFGKDITAQPAIGYDRFVSAVRQMANGPISRVCEIAIILEKGVEFFEKHGQFELEWPVFNLHVVGAQKVNERESSSAEGGESNN